MPQGIAITGKGIVCAIGSDASSVLVALQRQECGIGQMRYLSSCHAELPVGEVRMSNDEMKAQLGLRADIDYSRTALIGAIALRQAMSEAGVTAASLSGRKVVFVSGTTVGGMDVTERHFKSASLCAEDTSYVIHHDCGSNTREIASICGLDGAFTTISTACSSALNAIILAARMLLTGEADVVIAGGTEALSRFHLNGFNSLMILDKEPCKPFDARRRGLNLGEGAAYVVVERSADVHRRGATVQGYIGGWGNRCDAYHQTATSEGGEGAYLAMSDAIRMAGIRPEDVDYVNAHGTGTPNNDRSESAAMRRLFGESLPPVSSTKSFTGHTTSASGGIETVVCLLAMQHRFIPANLGWSEASEGCILPSRGETDKSLHKVLCNSFGFGGNDSSLLLCDEEVLLPEVALRDVAVASEVEVTADDSLDAVRQYVPPMELRRMSKQIKAAMLTSMRTLELAGIDTPDAIVIGTHYGMLEQGEQILSHLTGVGEEGLSPTLFMQSTHNTIAGMLAIRLKCHGYNITYSQEQQSMDWALAEARRLIAEGTARTVLVGVHDQCSAIFRELIRLAGLEEPALLYSKSVVLTAKQ